MKKTSVKRVVGLDVLRGLAIWLMVAFHALILADWQGVVRPGMSSEWWAIVWARAVASAFILISTWTLWWRSQHINSPQVWRRAITKQVIKVGLAALLVSLVSFIFLPTMPIIFGILHFLTVATLLTGWLVRYQIPQWLLFLSAAVIFLIGNVLMLYPQSLTGWEWMGLLSSSFASLDYVPLLPWLSVPLLGLGVAHKVLPLIASWPAERFGLARFWIWSGRHSLTIYLLHMPVLVGLFWLYALFSV